MLQSGKVDFAVFGIMLFLSTAIGIYHAFLVMVYSNSVRQE